MISQKKGVNLGADLVTPVIVHTFFEPPMNIKRSISFVLEQRKKDGIVNTTNVPVRMRVSFNAKRIDFNTGFSIDAGKWDKAKQRVKNGCFNKLKQSASEINSKLNEYEKEIQDVFKGYEVEEVMPSPEQVREAFNLHLNPKVEEEEKPLHNLFSSFDDFTRTAGKESGWTKATYQKFYALKSHLYDFNEHLSFGDLDEEGIGAFLNFLLEEFGFRNTTINKQLALLKWFLRWCLRKGYHNNTSFERVKAKAKTIQKKIIFLTWEELTKLREFVVPKNRQGLERVRDIFLFQCFTGLRYSDVFNLRRSDVKEDRIEVTTIKTSDSIIIELNQNSKAILDKYKDIPFEGNKALPVISNQKMNDELKVLGELVGIDEPVRQTYYKGNERIDEVVPKYAVLSTHAGRRTFICNALALGIAPQVVMKWTGHSDYKAMKPYIDVADGVKAQEMSKFDQL